MERVDDLKVFLGSLDPGVNKPKLVDLLQTLGLSAAEVIVPAVKPGKLAVAFCCFNSGLEALQAVQELNGMVDVAFSPSRIIAHLGLANGSL